MISYLTDGLRTAGNGIDFVIRSQRDLGLPLYSNYSGLCSAVQYSTRAYNTMTVIQEINVVMDELL